MFTRANILKSLLWRFAERCGAQFVSFVVSIVLARLLAPEDYGTIALVTVFTTILQVFVDSGLGSALIQKKNADDLDFSSVFYFNFGVCLLLYVAIFLAAPVIAAFYGNPSLIAIIRVISLSIIISGVKNIQQAYVSRSLLFKKFFFSTLGGTIFSAVLGIGLAMSGFGVWALVVQQLSNTAIDTVVLWITVRWYPKKQFSWQRLQKLLSYGWKLLLSSLLETGYNNLRNLIIGKLYTSADLAYYNQGDKFPKLIVNNINSSINSVLLPSMAAEQNDPARVKAMTRRAIKTSVYMMAPLMIGLACCADTVVRLLLTEKWLPCVLYLRIFCVSYLFWPIHTANLSAINALGRSDLFLRLEVVKKVIGLVLLLTTMHIGVEAMAYSLLVSSIISQVINAWPNRKLLQYPYMEQMRDILPSLLLACCMGGLVWLLQWLGWGNLVTLAVQVIMGAAFYLAASYLLKMEEFIYLWHFVEKIMQKRKKGKV